MKKIFYSQVRHRYANTWRKIGLENPDIRQSMPTYHYVKDSVKTSHIIYVCGLGLSGSLGLTRYHNVEHSQDISMKKTQANAFKRLGVFGKDSKLSDIACGYGFTLIAARPPNSDHSLFGFGLNDHSQIGFHQSRPGYPLELLATPSAIHLPGDSKAIKVSCGRSHSLILTEDRKVYSIGNNSLGQCGRAVKENEIYFGSKLVHRIEELPSNIESLVCGQDHSLFLAKDGRLFSCGWGADGQTGLGHYDVQAVPSEIGGALSGVKVVKVSSYADTVMALDEDGNVFGWGNSEYAQFKLLTNMKNEQFNEPLKLKLDFVPGKVVDIAAGGTICALLNDKGDVYVWGFGIIGLGPKVDHSSKPTLIPETLFGRNVYNPSIKVTKIFAGLSHFAALNSDGELFMWGKNRGGCLGLGHDFDQYFPWRVNTNMTKIKTISLGVDHTCAVAKKD